MNIVYFGYDMLVGCLKILLENPHNKIMKIYSFESDGYFDFNGEIKKIAAENGIEFTTERITANELAVQTAKGCDLFFCAGYAYRIPVEKIPSVRAVNIHPSLLPQGRGPWPMPWVILNGLDKWGVTAHKLEKEIDRGDILLSESFAVDSACETYNSLEDKIKKAAEKVSRRLVGNFERFWQNALPQQGGEYLPEPGDKERTVFSDTCEEKRSLIVRAFGQDYVIYSSKKENEGE